LAHSRRAGILAIGSLFVLTGPARALEILADDRFVHSYTDGTTLEPDFLAPFFASVPGASQSSSISQSADGLGFDGFASAFATSFLQQDPPALIRGESVFSISFRLDGAGTIDLSGTVGSFVGTADFAVVRLLADDTVLFEETAGFFMFATELPPGIYTLEARAAAGGVDENGNFFIDFDVLDTVPEPTTISLLTLGMVGLATRRRRRFDRSAAKGSSSRSNLSGEASTRRSLAPLAITASLVILGFSPARAALIYESAGTGPGTGSSVVISPWYDFSAPAWFGARFGLAQPVEVSAVGGRIYVYGDGPMLFAAIVTLPLPEGLPSWSPLDIEAHALAVTLFDAPDTADADVLAPLSVTLPPGNYGLVFGSGFFGATGDGGIEFGSPALPGASFLGATFPPQAPSASWFHGTSGPFPGFAPRIVIEGMVVPEPSVTGLLAIGLTGLPLVRRRCRLT
jgi:hypothetical protein